jgi:negative regulator of flagellin synthesis FlgM
LVERQGSEMTIDRLNSIDPIRDPQKPSPGGKAERARGGDSISISSDAAQKAELFKVLEQVKAAPEARSDRIAELKAKINEPSYMDDAVVSMTADRIIEQLFGA